MRTWLRQGGDDMTSPKARQSPRDLEGFGIGTTVRLQGKRAKKGDTGGTKAQSPACVNP